MPEPVSHPQAGAHPSPSSPWWVPVVQQLGMPTIMCLLMAFAIWQAGGKLVDAHVTHLGEVSAGLKESTTAIRHISSRLELIESKLVGK